MKINLIVAHSKNYGIGKNNMLPWKYKSDMKFFRETTSKKNTHFKNPAVLMGRNTWESLPKTPLPNRINYVLSTKLKNTFSFDNIQDIFNDCREKEVDVLWIIGGASIYDFFIRENLVDNMYVTIIEKKYDCDTFIKPYYEKFEWKLMSARREIEENTYLLFTIWNNKYKI